MRVRVDHARHDSHQAGVNDLARTGAHRRRRRARADGRDAVVLQQEIAGIVNVLGVVYRDDGAVLDEDDGQNAFLDFYALAYSTGGTTVQITTTSWSPLQANSRRRLPL